MTGWVLTLIGIIAIAWGIRLGGITDNEGFFALAALGLLLVTSGLVILGIYIGLRRRMSRAFKDARPLLRYVITTRDHASYAAAEEAEIRSTNRSSLQIALVFCGLVAVIGPFLVKENGIIFTLIGVGLALILTLSYFIITGYRIKKLKNEDREVILTPYGVYVGGEFQTWNLPATFLSEVAYFDSGKYENSPLALIRISYIALSRTIVTPYTILIPVSADMEEKAKAAVKALQNSVKHPKS